jgi:hypothetical protein
MRSTEAEDPFRRPQPAPIVRIESGLENLPQRCIIGRQGSPELSRIVAPAPIGLAAINPAVSDVRSNRFM